MDNKGGRGREADRPVPHVRVLHPPSSRAAATMIRCTVSRPSRRIRRARARVSAEVKNRTCLLLGVTAFYILYDPFKGGGVEDVQKIR